MKSLLNKQAESFTNALETKTKSGSSPAAAPAKKRRSSVEEVSEEEPDEDDDYKAALRKKPRKQIVTSPVKPAEWIAWECTAADAATIKKAFGGSTAKPGQLKGHGLMEVAEVLEGETATGTRAALAKVYEKKTGKSALARWARIDLIIGIIASEVNSE